MKYQIRDGKMVLMRKPPAIEKVEEGLYPMQNAANIAPFLNKLPTLFAETVGPIDVRTMLDWSTVASYETAQYEQGSVMASVMGDNTRPGGEEVELFRHYLHAEIRILAHVLGNSRVLTQSALVYRTYGAEFQGTSFSFFFPEKSLPERVEIQVRARRAGRAVMPSEIASGLGSETLSLTSSVRFLKGCCQT